MDIVIIVCSSSISTCGCVSVYAVDWTCCCSELWMCIYAEFNHHIKRCAELTATISWVFNGGCWQYFVLLVLLWFRAYSKLNVLFCELLHSKLASAFFYIANNFVAYSGRTVCCWVAAVERMHESFWDFHWIVFTHELL